MVLGIAAVSLVIWWLVRRRQKRVWLPTVRILELEQRLLPRLVFTLPPFIPFLCFLASAAAAVFFSLRPKEQVFTPFEPEQTRVHVLVDLSPSVSAFLSPTELALRVSDLVESLRPSGRVTVSTTHGRSYQEPKTVAETTALVQSAGFHRQGAKLGTVLREQLAEIGDVDRLFIVSDKDQHSWQDLQWRFLEDEMDVLFVDVATTAENVFIAEATYLSQPQSQILDWEVEVIRRGASSGEVKGKVTAALGGQTFGQEDFTIPAGRSRSTVRVSWPNSKSPASDLARREPLVWSIETIVPDKLALDNEFRTRYIGTKQAVALISAPVGERSLEDPVNQLSVSLSVLGFDVKRFDKPSAELDLAKYQFWVVVGGAAGSNYCPDDLARLRAKLKTEQGARTAGDVTPKVWLAPQDLNSDYQELCACYQKLVKAEDPNEAVPAYCANVTSRNQWLGLLPSLGAKQIGGEVGDSSQSLAFLGKDQATGAEVLAFTIPIRPSMAAGLSHAALPLLVKRLLVWQGLVLESSAEVSWPRPDNVVDSLWTIGPDTEPASLAKLQKSNVPTGESLLTAIADTELPPRWSTDVAYASNQVPMKKDQDDPLPWIILIAIICLAAMLIECIFSLFAFIRKQMRRRSQALVGALVLCALPTLTERADAEVAVISAGYGSADLSSLAREVKQRTSIGLETKLQSIPNNFTKSTQIEVPWLWVKGISNIREDNGKFKQSIVDWLTRGGFLIIEGSVPDADLAKLTAGIGGTNPEEVNWQPIPPDHELMRSFYLLDALPVCNSAGWSGFVFDARLAILAVPYNFLESLADGSTICPGTVEQGTRAFINLLMVALATDYKKDQIHLPEILKRLR
jgi:hypothetical protein